MIKIITNKINDWLKSKNVIDSGEEELLYYGISQIIINSVVICINLIIAFLLNEFVECIVFLVCFFFLRRYAGGYHAKTAISCCVISVISCAVVIFALHYINIKFAYLAGAWLVCLIIIILFAPVQNENKILDDIEKIIYKRRTIIGVLIESILLWLMQYFELYNISKAIVLTFIFAAVVISYGEILNIKNDINN